MKTIQIQLYKFEELSEAAQQKAIETNRDFNVDGDWFSPIYEGAKEDLEKAGFEDPKIQFSGFWSQGDGASFFATVNPSKFAETTNEKRISKLIENGNIENFVIRNNSFATHYSHEKTKYIDYDASFNRNIEEAVYKFADKIEAIRLNMCKEIYSNLETYYNELQADEAVKESLIINEYDYTEDGKIY